MTTAVLDVQEPPLDGGIHARGVVVDHVGKLGPIRALACPELDVAGGTSLAVIGPSGCGKSTLLGLLAGLAVPTRGTVRIGAETISQLSEPERVKFRRRSLGMVYQADNLLPHLTVERTWASSSRSAARTPPLGRRPIRALSSSGSGWLPSPRVSPTNCPVGSDNASRWPAPSSTDPP